MGFIFQNICDMAGIDSECVTQGPVVLLRNKLYDLYVHYLSNGINGFGKMGAHKSFKSIFVKEIYLNEITNKAHRFSYTKMRISNRRLAVERGRYYKIPRNERLCEFCKTHQIFQVEDEMHILLSCLKHWASRKDLFDGNKNKCHSFFYKLQKEE